MDEVEKLARKLIEVFEALEGLLLEQLAVPEDLDDPEGVVNLWVASEEAYGAEEEIVVQGQISVPATTVLASNVEDLIELFREELVGSDELDKAVRLARIVGRATQRRPVPSSEQAQLNCGLDPR